MYRFEIKKLLSKPLLSFILIAFFIVNGVKINMTCSELNGDNPLERARREIAATAEGPLTEEKTLKIINKYNELSQQVLSGNFSTDKQSGTYSGYIYGDWNLFRELYEKLEYTYNYEDNISQLLSCAEENIVLFSQGDNNGAVKYAKKLKKLYSGRKIYSFYDTEGWELYFSYNFSSLLLLLFIIYITSSLFSREKESGMCQLLSTSPNGRYKTTCAKLLAGFSLTALASILFYGEDYVIFNFILNLKGIGRPLYCLPYFIYTPFNHSLLLHMIVSVLAKTAGALSMASLYFFISKHSPSDLFSGLTCFTATLLLLAFSSFAKEGVSAIIYLLTPLALVSVNQLSAQYYPIEIAGSYISSFFLALLSNLILTAIFCIAIFCINKKRYLHLILHKRGESSYENI